MAEVIQVLLKILPIILLLGLGVWMRKSSFISKEAAAGLKKITMNITVPALLFESFLRADLSTEVLLLSMIIFAVCSLTFMLGFLFKKLQRTANPFYPSLFTTYLTGPIGFPLFIAYFGIDNFYRLAILDIGNSLFLFTILTVFLNTVSCDPQSRPTLDFSHHLKNLVSSPLTVSMLLGVAFSMTGFSVIVIDHPAGGALLDTIAILSGAAISMALILVGYELPLGFAKFKQIFPAVMLRMTMMLVLAYLIDTFIIISWLRLDGLYSAALYTMFILPPPFFIPLSIIGDCDHKQYVLDFISLHLLVSLIAFVGIMYVL